MAEKWIFDNDGGCDDTYALILGLSQPEKFAIICITVVSGNVVVDTAAKAMAKALEVCKAKIPIYLGAKEGLIEEEHPIHEIHGTDGQGDAPEYSKMEGYVDCIHKEMHAAEMIVKLANENAGNISIVATGPLTNIALALKLDPSIAKKFKRIVCMGGAHHAKGNTTWATEYNFYCDPEAAQICIKKVPYIEIITVENGVEFPLSIEDQTKWHNIGTVKGHFLHCISRNKLAKFGRLYLFDAIAMAVAMNPSVISKSVKMLCKVEIHGSMTRGTLLINWWGHKTDVTQEVPQTTIVMNTDPKAVMQMVIESTNK